MPDRSIRPRPGATCSLVSHSAHRSVRTTGRASGGATRPRPGSEHRWRRCVSFTRSSPPQRSPARTSSSVTPGGGFLARLFVWAYPRQTAGAVLVDATTFPYLTPEAVRRLPRTMTREGISTAAAVGESSAITTLGDIPLIVLGSNKPPLNRKFLQAQDAEAALSTDSVDAIALHSTHYIQYPAPTGQPQLVLRAVDAVVTVVRKRQALPPCSRMFGPRAPRCRLGRTQRAVGDRLGALGVRLRVGVTSHAVPSRTPALLDSRSAIHA